MKADVHSLPAAEVEAIERAILGALAQEWPRAALSEAATDEMLDALLPFGAHAATKALVEHSVHDKTFGKPDLARVLERARAIRSAAPGASRRCPSRPRGCGLEEARGRPETIARSERIRGWAAGLSDAEYAGLVERGGPHTKAAAAKRDLRTTTVGRATLIVTAQRVAPTTVPIPLRGELDSPQRPQRAQRGAGR